MVLMNETPTTWFQSNMGLQKGDPLSTYLFIIGAKKLLKMVKCEQEKGRLFGLPIRTGHGFLGHLMLMIV